MVQMQQIEQVFAYLESLGLIERPFFSIGEDSVVTGLKRVFSKRFDKDLMTYQTAVFRDKPNGVFCVAGFTATLTKMPEIDLGVFEGIGANHLDIRLSGYNWNQDFKAIAGSSRAQLEAFNDLILLSQLYNKEANRAANLLMLKHWAGTPLERTVRIEYDPLLQTTLHFGLNKDLDDINALQAYHLLCGGAVLLFEMRDFQPRPSRWTQLVDGAFTTYPLFDLAGQLKKLPLEKPLSDFMGQEIITALINGGRPELELTIAGRKLAVVLVADPAAGALKAFTTGAHPEEIPLALGSKIKAPPRQFRPGTRK